MSKLGKFLLTHCTNELIINLRGMRDQIEEHGCNYWEARVLAIFLGMTIVEGHHDFTRLDQ